MAFLKDFQNPNWSVRVTGTNIASSVLLMVGSNEEALLYATYERAEEPM